MFSRFFIDRPIFASVLSIVITLAGAISLFMLPLAQYPAITPPTISVMCNYPGASAQVVAETVAAPIEQQVNGVENMMYLSSQSTNDGSYSLSVTFKPGVDLNFAQVLVQNRVNLALPNLPDVVRQTGVTTRKRSPDILLIVSLYSKDGSRDNLFLSNFATIQLKDELARVEGVGDVFLFGQQDYSMRIWVDPEKLASYDITAGDVARAVREQNQQVACGQLGSPPIPGGQEFQFTLATLGRLSEASQFADIIIKATSDGRQVRLSDVGRVVLGAKTEDIVSRLYGDDEQDPNRDGAASLAARLKGKPTVSIAIFALPDANALDTRDRVIVKMEELKKSFPTGIDYKAAYDTTPFIRESVHEVFATLRDAIILVALVVLIFLQNWRSTIIPLVAVPVAIIGTFAIMAVIGFSLNNLTLFGLVLAIGIVVDDAIVVVEAVEHHIEQGMQPRAAAIRAMEEVSGPVIAVALVLSAVFVPCAFISGIVGQFFKQFALTIAVSTIISAFNSLTLSPALAAILLQSRGAKKDAFARVLDVVLGWFFKLFNIAFRAGTNGYTRLVRLALRGTAIVLILYVALLGLTGWGFFQRPTGYIPAQDKGDLRISVQLPDLASLERSLEVVQHVARIAQETPGVDYAIAVAGQSFVIGAYGSNFGNLFIPLEDFASRRRPDQHTPATKERLRRLSPEDRNKLLARGLHSDDVANHMRKRIAQEIPEAIVIIFGPPAVSGLGTTGGFKFMVEDRGDLGLDELQKQTENLIRKANEYRVARQAKKHDEDSAKAERLGILQGLYTVYRNDSPQLFVDVNREQASRLGVQLKDIFDTLQIYLGSLYVNDFNRFGRTWQVVLQAEGQFRNEIEDVRRLKVRNSQGGMVPLGTVASVREINGPLLLTRYNMYRAAAVTGDTSPGYSSGQAIAALKQLAAEELPPGMSYEWTEITYIQVEAGNTAMLIFALSVFGVFLVLAAQYESWSLPLAVILVVPMCLLGSIIGVTLGQSDINIFTQIGFVVLVGLASKNAILIVEFAKVKREAGMSREEATIEASQLRLRPILMTSFAFILGVVPLILGTGAGAEMRWALGVAVFSGMLGVTLFGIFLTPVFFYVINWVSETPTFATPLMRRASKVLLWVFVIGGCALEVVVLAVFWRMGVVSLGVVIVVGCALAALVALMVWRAVRVPESNGNGAPAPPVRPAAPGDERIQRR
ncbi:MAG TPA: efflux RND transporter permease subunit [Gemmataceae bacterium]|nr:efflux RND transporter permease subunit [Gemmataceae bacterium]